MDRINPLATHHVSIAGNPDAAQTIIFVHGFGSDQSVWDVVATPFLPDYRVIRFDNAGAGQFDSASFVQHSYLNLHGFVDDLLAICAALDLRDTILIGHSVGGMIGVLASIKQPKYFSKLILIGASPRYLDDGDYRGGLSKENFDAIYSAIALTYHTWVHGFAPLAMGNADRSELATKFAQTLAAIPPQIALTVACAIFQSDHRRDLDQVSKPTLIIQANDDLVVPLEVAKYLHQHIRGSRLALINATGHLPHVSAPAEVVAAIQAFLAD